MLSQSAAYFRDTVNRAPADARAVLEAFARGEQKPAIPTPARRWLDRRCLLNPDGTLAIPVFAEWIRQEVLV